MAAIESMANRRSWAGLGSALQARSPCRWSSASRSNSTGGRSSTVGHPVEPLEGIDDRILHENQRLVAVREQLTQPISDEPGPLPDPPLLRVHLHQQPARLLR